jgi:hypothetical protein
MILSIFTFAHVAISLIGIFSGLVVAYALINARQLDRWTSVFLWTTALTSVTGFMFPFHGFQPSYVVGAISLVVLALAIFALYRQHLAGGWRATYVISSMIGFISQCVRFGGAAFPPRPSIESARPDTDRAGLQDYPVGRASGVRSHYRSRRRQVPPCAASHGVIPSCLIRFS